MRTQDPRKLGQIVAAALRVFGRHGYARTQMADVAAEAGVSVGTLYNYVAGKEALLLVSVLAGFDDLDGADLPFTVPDRPTMVRRLQVAVGRRITLTSLEPGRGRDRPSLADVVGELFDLLAAPRHLADAFERCAVDAPDLAAVFYTDARGRLVDQLAGFVAAEARADAPPPPVVARHIVETVTWWARHRHHDPTVEDVGEAEARRLAIALLTSPLTASEP